MKYDIRSPFKLSGSNHVKLGSRPIYSYIDYFPTSSQHYSSKDNHFQLSSDGSYRPSHYFPSSTSYQLGARPGGRYYNQPVNYGRYTSHNPVTQSNYYTQDIGYSSQQPDYQNIQNTASSVFSHSHEEIEDSPAPVKQHEQDVTTRPYTLANILQGYSGAKTSSQTVSSPGESNMQEGAWRGESLGETFVTDTNLISGNMNNRDEGWTPSFTPSQFIGPLKQDSSALGKSRSYETFSAV